MKKTSLFRLSLLANAVLIGLFAPNAYATTDEVEFNTSFFAGSDGDDNKYLETAKRLGRGHYIPADQYDADVFVNGTHHGRMKIRYVEQDEKSFLCYDPEFEKILDFKEAAFKRDAQASHTACMLFNDIIPEAKTKFNMGILRLDIEIAQALTIQRPRGYISPNRWQTGVPAAYVNYNLSHLEFRSGKNSEYNNAQSYISLNTGLNIGEWALRHSGSQSWSEKSGLSQYNWGNTYLQHAIEPIKGVLTLGDLTTNGVVMDSLALRGVSIASDERMRPQSQRGYAPRIQGSAKNNAMVNIYQHGSIIYQTNVAAGPFIISDLYPTGTSGELLVEIIEVTGETYSYKVPFATLIPLVRPGQLKYQVATGFYRYGSKVGDDLVATSNLQYGVANNLTVNGGFVLHSDYFADNVGFALNTPIGAFASDITQSKASFNDGQTLDGYSVRASYNYNHVPTKTNVMLATYRHSSRDYYTLGETLASNMETGSNNSNDVRNWDSRIRNQYQVSISQSLGEKLGSFALFGSTNSYWGNSDNEHHYQLSYSNRFKRLSYQFNAQYSQLLNGRDNSQYSLSFSLPLFEDSKKRNNGYYTANINAQDDYYSLSHSFSQSAGEYNQLGYSLSHSTNSDNQQTGNASMSYRGDKGVFGSSISIDSDNNYQASASVSGGVVIHPKGITLSQSVGDTFAIIHAQNGKGGRVGNGLGRKLDRFGNAIVENVTPYEINAIRLDTQGLPIDVQFNSTEQQIIPRANSAMLVQFESQRNSMVVFNIRLDNGQEVPMGLEASDHRGDSVGYVAQGGMLFANRLSEKTGKIQLRYGAKASEQCSFDYELETLNTQHIQTFDVVCKTEGE